MTSKEKIKELQKELNSCIVEREDQVEGLLAALLSDTHVLLLGPPGTAKSLLANSLCNSIDGAKYFQWLLTKFSSPEEVFGPVSMTQIKQDKFIRVTTGKLPEAHIGFLDEIFKANSAILNSLLTLINERKFHNNGTPQTVPLLTCVGASNELPQGEELGALYDRFILRYWVAPIQDDAAFCNLLEGSLPTTITTKLTLEEIAELKKEVEKVAISKEMLQTLRTLHFELKNEGVTASDRRWKSSVKIMKALAFLRGNSEVTEDELSVLSDILWEDPKDRKLILKVVSPRANPINALAVELLDSAKEIHNKWKSSKKDEMESIQAHKALKEISAKIESDLKNLDTKKSKKLRDVQGKIEELRQEIVKSFGI